MQGTELGLLISNTCDYFVYSISAAPTADPLLESRWVILFALYNKHRNDDMR